ncbi:MAG: hypothetical protein IJZ79_05165 [Bacilli bacterium]|nr:hypothetical protein [Bacilli bacterium]
MDKKKILTLENHFVYYVKTELLNYYITIPKKQDKTNICIELKNKMNNYNLELNDEIWVMENIKNTFSYIDEYNITLVLPILSEESVSILEKIDNDKFEDIDKLLGYTINSAYSVLKNEEISVEQEVILVNNDRFKTFINWFTTRYRNRIVCKNLLELIQLFNVNATSYKKLETPAMTFVVGSYNTEVDAPTALKKEEIEPLVQKPVPQTSSGFTSYWLLAIITIVVAVVVAFIAFKY